MKIAKNNNFDGKLPAEMLENQQITPIFPENPPLETAPLTNKIKIMQKYSFAAIFAKIYFCRNIGHCISIFSQIGPLYIYS